jgi:hypothetical protein
MYQDFQTLKLYDMKYYCIHFGFKYMKIIDILRKKSYFVLYFENMGLLYKLYDYNFKRNNFKLKNIYKALKYIILNTLGVDSPFTQKSKYFVIWTKNTKLQHILIILLRAHQYNWANKVVKRCILCIHIKL